MSYAPMAIFAGGFKRDGGGLIFFGMACETYNKILVFLIYRYSEKSISQCGGARRRRRQLARMPERRNFV